MGFTALDGLVMATRRGSLNPGAMLYLVQSRGMPEQDVEETLYYQSDLLGVSGIGSAIRDLAASNDPRARQAIEVFVHRIVQRAGGLVAHLGGLDGVVFTAGAGERDPALRAAVCTALSWLSLTLDNAANAAGGTARVSAAGSKVEAWVIPTDEEAVIARHAAAVLEHS